jgi:hypothetical protein
MNTTDTQTCGCYSLLTMAGIAIAFLLAALTSCAIPPASSAVTAHAEAGASTQGMANEIAARAAFWGGAR